MSLLLDPLIVGVCALLAVLAISTSAIAFILQDRFPDVWRAEGEPRRWLDLNRTSFKQHIFRFLDQKRYLATGGPGYARLCATARIGWYL
jgi:hypothetical protein